MSDFPTDPSTVGNQMDLHKYRLSDSERKQWTDPPISERLNDAGIHPKGLELYYSDGTPVPESILRAAPGEPDFGLGIARLDPWKWVIGDKAADTVAARDPYGRTTAYDTLETRWV